MCTLSDSPWTLTGGDIMVYPHTPLTFGPLSVLNSQFWLSCHTPAMDMKNVRCWVFFYVVYMGGVCYLGKVTSYLEA